MLAAMRLSMRSAIVISVLVGVAVCLGCTSGEDRLPGSVEDVRPCLEGSAADVVSPPLVGNESFSFALRGSGWTSAGFVRPAAGSVGFLAFFETEETASEVSELFKSRQLEVLPGSVALELELYGKALLLWRRPVTEPDRSLVAACLQSGEKGTGGAAIEPAKPLGCVVVFLASDATPAEVRQVKDSLHREPLIRNVQFVSKSAALEHMRKRFPELTKNLKTNPLPDAFRVGPRRGQSASQIGSLLRRYPQVDVVRMSALPCSLVEPAGTG